MDESQFFTARQAARELGIRRETLYSYVSRGMIRSEPGEPGGRERRYYREDVQRLKDRKAGRRDPERLVASSLHWGSPLLESAITLIAGGRYAYRGRDALELAEGASLEAVAALIWTGEFGDGRRAFFPAGDEPLPRLCKAILPQLGEFEPLERMQAVLALAAAEDEAAYDLEGPALFRTAGRAIHRMAVAAAGPTDDRDADLAEILAGGWGGNNLWARGLISAALVVCADHELNISAFTARCTASAGATPYAILLAGLSALSGTRHGGMTLQVEGLLAEVGAPERARSAITTRLKRGQPVPGFGHPLYPAGDPRASYLLSRLERDDPGGAALLLAQEICSVMRELTGKLPSLDLGLAALGRSLDLPPGGALALFAIGRAVGWIGHAREQLAHGRLIRPRARYIGPRPGPTS